MAAFEVERVAQSNDGLLEFLEMQYDCTPERVGEAFSLVGTEPHDHAASVAAVNEGLKKLGVQELSDQAIDQVTSGQQRQLSYAEFELVVKRLKLEQLLNSRSPTGKLIVVDYSSRYRRDPWSISGKELVGYFFGHRQSVDQGPSVVRWVHMVSFDMQLLLALTVKYGFHPLGVEDVLEQCPTKIDRYGNHYFIAVELLVLASSEDLSGMGAVQVTGQHVTVFVAGPPMLDTVITIVQDDKTFDKEWPRPFDNKDLDSVFAESGCPLMFKNSSCGEWMKKLRERLRAPHSRLRDRRADFLAYSIIDCCTDELVRVVRAYTARLARLEGELRKSQRVIRGCGPSFFERGVSSSSKEVEIWAPPELPEYLPEEASQARLQLDIVARRARSLQRVVRRILSGQEPEQDGPDGASSRDGDSSSCSSGIDAGVMERLHSCPSPHRRPLGDRMLVPERPIALVLDHGLCKPSNRGYWQDCDDHLAEAYDDAIHLAQRCSALVDAYDRVCEKVQDRQQRENEVHMRYQSLKTERQTERLNNILFVFTVGELAFAPVQFMAGVYGMNFVDGDGTPTIPELLDPQGYFKFWAGTALYLLVVAFITVWVYHRLNRQSDPSAPAVNSRSFREKWASWTEKKPSPRSLGDKLLKGPDSADYNLLCDTSG